MKKRDGLFPIPVSSLFLHWLTVPPIPTGFCSPKPRQDIVWGIPLVSTDDWSHNTKNTSCSLCKLSILMHSHILFLRLDP